MYRALHKANERKRKADVAFESDSDSDTDSSDAKSVVVVPNGKTASSSSEEEDDDDDDTSSSSDSDSDDDDEPVRATLPKEDDSSSEASEDEVEVDENLPTCLTVIDAPVYMPPNAKFPICLLCPRKVILKDNQKSLDVHLNSSAHARRTRRFQKAVDKILASKTPENLPRDPRDLVIQIDTQVVESTNTVSRRDRFRKPPKTHGLSPDKLAQRNAKKEAHLAARKQRKAVKKVAREARKAAKAAAKAADPYKPKKKKHAKVSKRQKAVTDGQAGAPKKDYKALKQQRLERSGRTEPFSKRQKTELDFGY